MLQIFGAALLAVTAWTMPQLSSQDAGWLGRIAWCVAALALLQFVPLPAAIWEALPGRSQIALELSMLGVDPKPALVTLLFHESLASLAWAIPAIALFIALRRAGSGWEQQISLVVVGVTLVALVIGLVQFVGGPGSKAYFYEFTNRGYLVGIFANANHMATLLLVSMPFLAAIFRLQLDEKRATSLEMSLLAALCAALIAIGIALVGSLTGYALVMPVIIASIAILFPNARRVIAVLFAGSIALGAAIFLLSGVNENVFEKEVTSSTAGRAVLNDNTLDAISDFFPSGTGLGTFQEVYTRYESLDQVDATYANHAHNDYLEIILEFGLPGLLLLCVFLVWWASRARLIWSSLTSSPFAKAAVIASATLLVHSAWDYPLRTAALSSIFVLSCVLMSQARNEGRGFEYKRSSKV
ncbi:O-antigen ligase family protein [Altererythrobacter sp. GH1-8]|uniref:O-antigen ligase family protein n=1 Tax=Altererythrobacter sp. GH1-8 TaxID=3349333 RepID=UPI00374D87D9